MGAAVKLGIGAVDFSKLLDGPAFWGAVGVVATQLVNWAIQRRKTAVEGSAAIRQAETEAKRQESFDREAAFKQLLEVVNTLRSDLSDLRQELEDEREMRKKAETQVRTLRDELHALRNSMQKQGMKVPPAPMGDPPV